MPVHPESVPINMLVKVEGTPFEDLEDLDPFDFIRTIAVARILMPKSHVRLSAGREEMNEQMQAMAFFAGANSIFYGEKLLTTPNPKANKDMQLFDRLGIQPEPYSAVEHRRNGDGVQEYVPASKNFSSNKLSSNPQYYDAAS
jgi:biotin synthase